MLRKLTMFLLDKHRNWRRYAGVNNDEYENGDDGGYLDEEAARNGSSWERYLIFLYLAQDYKKKNK